jgi:hypothetical protein
LRLIRQSLTAQDYGSPLGLALRDAEADTAGDRDVDPFRVAGVVQIDRERLRRSLTGRTGKNWLSKPSN